MEEEKKKICKVCGQDHSEGQGRFKHGVLNWTLYFLRAKPEQLRHFESPRILQAEEEKEAEERARRNRD